MNTVVERLKDAKELIKDEQHWTKGTSARNRSGKSCESLDESAHSFCMLGAVQRANSEATATSAAFVGMKACAALKHSLPKGFKGFTGTIEFNDSDDTTHKDVLDVFDTAIEYAKTYD